MKMKKTEVKMQYEITMYKLLILFGISLIVFLAAGFWMGNLVGGANQIDDVNVEVPEYCRASYRGDTISVHCTELEEYTALELCNILSTPLKDKIKVVVISSE